MRNFSLFLILLLAVPAYGQSQTVSRKAEIISIIDTIEDQYAYLSLDSSQLTKLRTSYADQAHKTRDVREYVRLLENLADEFHDNHLQLNTNLSDSYRLVPSQTHLLLKWESDDAVVAALRPFSSSAPADLGVGDVIETVDGVPVLEAVINRLRSHVDNSSAQARDWALNQIVAGRRDRSVLIGVRRHKNKQPALITIPEASHLVPAKPSLTVCRSDKITYVRLNDSLGQNSLISDFKKILSDADKYQSIIVDLRDTPSGGNSLIARSILGHFVRKELPYQMHELPSDFKRFGIVRRWLELVSPYPPYVEQRATVLVGPWTGSMGEGLAIGFDSTGTGTVFGGQMARLRGATSCIAIPSLGVNTCLNLPTERLFHIDGTAREQFFPPAIQPEMLNQISRCPN